MDRQQVQIRQARKSDIKDLLRLQREFETYLQSLTDKKRNGLSTAEHERRFIENGFGKKPAFRTLIARKEGKALGYIAYHFGYDPDEMEGKVVYVIDLFVRDSTRGMGVGTSLMDSVADICKEQGGIAVYFGVWNKNKAAITFYKKLGAEFVIETPFMMWPKSKW